MATSTKELTSGTIWKQVVSFALPLLAASLVQLLYNFVNQVFAGQFIGTHASAAIAASALLLACLVNFFNGLGVGASVIVSRHFVQEGHEDYSKALHTSAAIALFGGVALMAIGLVLAPVFLTWLQTPAEVFDDAVLYLRIYFISGLPMVAYNLLAGVIRALGNSKSPMVYQIIGGFVNVAVNILLVAVLQIGVAGPAVATVLAQGICAVLAFRYLLKLDDHHRLYPRRIRIDGPMLSTILKIGVPAGVQMMSITLSNLVIQAQINLLGVDEIAAFAYYFQLENFIYNPIVAVGQTVMVFVSHNLAVGLVSRARKGVRVSIGIGIGAAVLVGAVMIVFAPQFFSLFTADEGVIAIGVSILRFTFPFYFFYVFIEVFSNAARGAGRSWQPMAIILSVMCGLRLIILFVFVNVIGGVLAIAAVYPVTWFVAGALLAIYYFASRCFEKAGFDEKDRESQAEELAEMKLDNLSVPPEEQWATVREGSDGPADEAPEP